MGHLTKVTYEVDGERREVEVAEGTDLVDLPDGRGLVIEWTETLPQRVARTSVISREEAERLHVERGDCMFLDDDFAERVRKAGPQSK